MSRKKNNTNGIVYSTDPGFRPQEEEHIEEETPEPGRQQLKIKLDTKHRGGKTVTLVQNFSGRPDDLESLGKQLKAFCGTGGTVKDGEIVIQGDQRDKIAQFLKKYGYKFR